jgi:hypothetical protein
MPIIGFFMEDSTQLESLLKKIDLKGAKVFDPVKESFSENEML